MIVDDYLDDRPYVVHYGFYTLLGYIIISFMDFGFQKIGVLNPINSSDDFMGYLVQLIWLLFLFSHILKRRNWARWVYTLLIVLGVPQTIYSVITMFEMDVPVALFTAVESVLLTLSVYFLLTDESSQWFVHDVKEE